MTPFARFVAIDWTGAKGVRHRAIAVAEADAVGGPPRLVRPGHRWSRTEVLNFIESLADDRALIGIDCSFSLPFVDRSGYFPGDADEPGSVRTLWAEVDAACVNDPDLGAHGYIARRRNHFWTGLTDGDQRDFSRLRAADALHRSRRMGNPASPYVLLGASQVGKATLSGMRLLHHAADIPVWPFDPLPAQAALLVEIYCQTFALDGGVRGKIRTRAALNAALAHLGSEVVETDIPAQFDDHVGDALISAAGMRRAAADPAYWDPPHLTDEIQRTEGWTFGIL